jgi:hypothetical protein
MRACNGHCGVRGEHRRDIRPCPGRPAARHVTRLVDGLPVPILQVREGRDHGHHQRRRDTPRRAYPVTPETEPCPYCRVTSGVQSTPAPPRVQAWTCTACRTDWAITVVNPQLYFDRLAATVEQLGATRSVLRQVITLADDAATLSDKELRDRLVTLADRARLAQRPLAMTADQTHGFALTGQTPRGVKLPR